jgi:hypothetical protein
MSDALERFMASLGQGRVILNPMNINDIVQSIVVGRAVKPASEPAPAASFSAPAETGTSAFETYTPGQDESQGAGAFSSDPLAFNEQPTEEAAQQAGREREKALQPRAAARPAARKRKAKSGLTRAQWIILVGMIVFWLCAMAGAAIYIYITYFANA